MGDVDLEKLRSVRQGGKTRGKAKVRDVDGRGRTFEIEHGDGRQSAVVRPDAIRRKISVKEL